MCLGIFTGARWQKSAELFFARAPQQDLQGLYLNISLSKEIGDSLTSLLFLDLSKSSLQMHLCKN